MENCELYVPRCLDGEKPKDHRPEHSRTFDILRNETLFALGEALIELTYYTPLSSPDKLTRYDNAIKMAKKLQQDELGGFASVVANCLVPSSPNQLEFDLEGEPFLQWYYENIVLPLKEDYEIFLQAGDSLAISRSATLAASRKNEENTGQCLPDTSGSIALGSLQNRAEGGPLQGQTAQPLTFARNIARVPEFKAAGNKSRKLLQGIKMAFESR